MGQSNSEFYSVSLEGSMGRYNIAQVNIGRIRAELNDPVMAGFVNRLDGIKRWRTGARDSCGGSRGPKTMRHT